MDYIDWLAIAFAIACIPIFINFALEAQEGELE